jgi:phosphoribosylformimino-5-aminoimidazole carboxamide ribonucleotide (ProFAR) isomerase
MRVGASIILHEGRCIQSYGWKLFRPLGSLKSVMDSLEEYECDEVAIIRPIRNSDNKNSFLKDINVLSRLQSMTPISFGGGIRSIQHLEYLKNLPIERLILSSSFIDKDTKFMKKAINLFGKQAIQCLLPITYVNKEFFIYHCSKNKLIPLNNIKTSFIDNYANEIIIYDIDNDGFNENFNDEIVNNLPFSNKKIVLTGGIRKDSINWARKKDFASVLIDNKVLHNEFSVKGYKK